MDRYEELPTFVSRNTNVFLHLEDKEYRGRDWMVLSEQAPQARSIPHLWEPIPTSPCHMMSPLRGPERFNTSSVLLMKRRAVRQKSRKLLQSGSYSLSPTFGGV